MRLHLCALSLCLLLPACKSSGNEDGNKSDAKAAKGEGGSPDVEARPAPVGQWVGVLDLPGDLELSWAVSIQAGEDGGERPEAKLWIPEQMVSGVPLGPPVVSEDGSMIIRLRSVGASWTIVPGAEPTCTFTQKGATFPCTVTSTKAEDFAAIVDPQRPQTPEPPFPYAIEELEIENPKAEGVTLAATLTVPEGEGPHPAVVLISGSGLQDRDETIANHKPFWVIADHLSRRGVAVLRYDDRGFGESTGEASELTLEDLASDTWAAAKAVAAREEIDGEKIGLIGHSEGGVIAPLVATQHPDEIAYLVLLAGTGVTGSELIIHQLGLLLEASGADEATIEAKRAEAKRLHEIVLNNSPEDAPAALEAFLRQSREQLSEAEKKAAGSSKATLEAQLEALNKPWFRHFLAWDPAPILAELEVPVLVMAGELDLQVDPAQNLRPMRDALADNPKAEFVLLPGLNHLFQPATKGTPAEYVMIEQTISTEVLEEMTRFIRKAAK